MIPKKTTKMIVKDGNGDYLQLLPEAYTDSALNASSSDPISNAAAMSALNAAAERVTELSLFKVMDEEPTALNTQGTADKAIFAWIQPETWSITESIYDASEDYGQIPFCLYGIENASITIDWGDGTIEEYAAENAVEHECPTHEYAAAGNYTITMESQDFSRIYLQVIFIEGSECPRYYLSTLKSINSPLPKIAGVQGQSADWDDETGNYAWISQDNSFASCFFFASNLESIPSNLFKNNSSVTDFSYCFLNCTSLQSIPSGLFDSNTAATGFNGCFSGCSSLQSIPSGLFDKNTAATRFDYCFNSCSSLTSIPAGLFDRNTAATNFDSCFYRCSSLQSIPEELFDKNTAATSFYYCFRNCSSLADFTLHIGSSSVSSCNSFVTNQSGTTRTIYVPSGSTTQTTFNAVASSLGLTVIGE